MARSLSKACFALAVSAAVAACTSSSSGPAPCTFDGKSYASGTSFPSSDGCNTCSCQNGAVACTLRACFDAGPDGGTTCTYNGTVYHPGDTFPAGDGCNTCSCQSSGAAACTKIACQVDAGNG